MKIFNPIACYETDGTRFGFPVYCMVNAYGDCPYCDQEGKCHIADPIEDCDDFAAFFDSWDDWLVCDDEVEPDDDNCDYEIGYDPYLGSFSDDC